MLEKLGHLAEVHGAVFPAASISANDTTLADLVVKVSWSRLRGHQQTCRDGRMLSKYREEHRADPGEEEAILDCCVTKPEAQDSC